MPITRNTKTGGGTNVNSGQTWNADDINGDMNTVFGKFDAGIVNADISASAAIDISKINTSGAITSAMIADGAIVNADVNASADLALTKLADISATDDAHDDTTTPGDSASHTLPTTLQGELQQIRYAVERQALGLAAARYDATGTQEATFWGDLPARQMHWVQGINGVVTSGLPSGWTNVSTATLAQEAADAADKTAGKGRAIKITAAGGANEGLSFPLSGLKASTRYFVCALMKATSGDTAKFDTTGADATSSFRNITVTTTATAWTWLYGVVQTDSTPTNIVLRCLAAADTDIVWVSHVGWAECAATPLAGRVAVVEQSIAATAGTEINGTTTDAGLDTNYQFIDNGSTDLDATVYVPGDGYFIRVTADICVSETTTDDSAPHILTWRIYQSVSGGALSAARTKRCTIDHDGSDGVAGDITDAMVYVVKNPTPGASYRFAVAATRSGGAGGKFFTPQKGNVGSSALTIEVIPYGG